MAAPAGGKKKVTIAPTTPPTTAPVSVAPESSFLVWTLPSASLTTTAVSWILSWPAFSTCRRLFRASPACSVSSNVITTS
jgi:hypothetical protein